MILNFTSWWYENNEKQQISIVYLHESKSLSVTIKSLQPITISSPSTANGREIDIYDLYVGSEIDILGKFTILKHCDANTAKWVEKTGNKLRKVRERLIEEIRKYENSPFPQRLLVHHFGEIPGEINLKGIAMQISELKGIFMKYRPQLAAQIVGEMLNI